MNITRIIAAICMMSFIIIVAASCSKKRVCYVDKQSELLTVLWIQKAAEYRALAYQAYNIAKLRLKEELRNKRTKKRAVVVDIDETVLDNSPYLAKTVLANIGYPTGWKKWCDMVKAEPVPGALEFLTFADAMGVSVYYISNRYTNVLSSTIKNLKKLGFPQVKKSHIFLRKNKHHTKTIRRARVSKTHYICMLVGDNLADFATIFGDEKVPHYAKRAKIVDKYKKLFGKKFIVLPNPNYGDFLKSIPTFSFKKPQSKRDKVLLDALQTYGVENQP